MKPSIINILSVIILCTSCSSMKGTHNSGRIQGMVYDYENKPIPNYAIQLNASKPIYTDINGRFSFNAKKNINCTLNGNGTEHCSIKHTFKFTDTQNIVYFKIPSLDYMYLKIDSEISNKNIEEAKKVLLQIPKDKKKDKKYTLYSLIIKYYESHNEKEKQNIYTKLKKIY